MKDDIKPPVNTAQFIKFEHADSSDCPMCRMPDKAKRSEARLHYRIKQLAEENQRLLATCKHPVTRLISFDHLVEDERGRAVEQEDVEQCVAGCGRLPWERI